MNRSLLKTLLPMLMLAFASIESAIAQIPQTINYQGYLTNSEGKPVNGTVNVAFRLYNAEVNGAVVWEEVQSAIAVANGVFTAALGKVAPLNLPFNVPYFLSLQVNTDAEMAGRQPLSAVPYALRAAAADGVAANATIRASQITGTIASSQFAATQLLPTVACTANQFSQWNGSAWVCAAAPGGTVTGVTASTPLASSGGATPNISLGVVPITNGGTGANSQNFVDLTTAQTISGDKSFIGNLSLPNTTPTTGIITKGGSRFIHDYGFSNTFVGLNAGNFTMTGTYNTATGVNALFANTIGSVNTASGADALTRNTTGAFNTASGSGALRSNETGNDNTASGASALPSNTTGSRNIGIGVNAGSNLTTGNNNIAIGHRGAAAESATTRIGDLQTRAFIAGIRGITTGFADAIPVVIDGNGQLGTVSSSRAVKDDIADMNDASNALMQLRPVTFRYKAHAAHGSGDDRPLQYGLIAEEVAEVAPELVARDGKGEIETVFYQHLPPMLLNEFQKQQRTIQTQQRSIQTQAMALARQRTRMIELEQKSAEVETLKREMLDIKAMLGSR